MQGKFWFLWGTFLPADTIGTSCGHARSPWVLHVSGITGKEKVGVIGHGFHEDLGLLLPREGQEAFLWSSGMHWDIS